MAKLELFGAARCPHTEEMREWLEWKGSDFVEYDVEADAEARRRRVRSSPASAAFPYWSKMAKLFKSAGRATVAWWNKWNNQSDNAAQQRMPGARSIRVRGVVQGVGFRPFVFRLARANALAGWVLNGEEGVEIYLEGTEHSLDDFCSRPHGASAARRQYCGNRGSICRAARPAGLYDP